MKRRTEKRSAAIRFQKPIWKVLTGRRDGNFSSQFVAFEGIPLHTADFSNQKRIFRNKGLTVRDLVVLSGSHTIGLGHCNLFNERLYNFTGKGDSDPSLDPSYATILKTKCKCLNDFVTTVPMNPIGFS